MNHGPLVFDYAPPDANRTLFLDRDGVLNEAVLRDGGEISSPRVLSELVLSQDLMDQKTAAAFSGWNLVILTNQPDLERRRTGTELISEINDQIRRYLPLNLVLVCPHTGASGCNCRKPATAMYDYFVKRFPNCTQSSAYIGDRETDYHFARNLKIPFFLRRRHYNQHLQTDSPVIDHLAQIADFL
ncbi:MAG: HAD-IIIA family hydrolase [Deltaproteobacteria bacterium]|nr:HAD-IIIA family hydrolase [Deltaproteobacteria bacterium]